MVVSRLARPAGRLLLSSKPNLVTPSPFSPRPTLSQTTNGVLSRRRYATPAGTKEVAVRDALNEALAEELESNDKVFVLGEEVAQYNGA